MSRLFNQSDYSIRCEWGEYGIRELAPISDTVIIVDVLSFSTTVEIAASRGATVFPYRWKDSSVYTFAESVSAEVADGRGPKGYSLSPSTMTTVPASVRLVLPSPNGATLSTLSDGTKTLAGCLRNCEAVARSAMRLGSTIAVIPAGERWPDGSLRPCLEDLLGAGAIINYLTGIRSPEAAAAEDAYSKAAENILDRLAASGSGKEKIERGEEMDVSLAAEANTSQCVPMLSEGAFVMEFT